MRIATLTFHRALNYGAVLQTYALQKTLIDLGYDTCVLDYRSKFIENHYKPDHILNHLSVKGIAIVLLRNGLSIVRREQFEEFLEKNIIISPKAYDENNISESERDYDLFCVGSDQIWNYKTAGFDKTYFLDFVNEESKKCSYAASIGLVSLPEEYEAEYRNLLCSFRKISIREQEGAKLINRILNQNKAITVLDPTLLIGEDGWRLLEEKIETPKKYVLVYLLSENKKILKFARQLAKENKCEILYINNQFLPVWGMNNKRQIKPEEWLYLFRNASYVVTNSFHGTVFSVIFQKKFWCDYLPTSGNVNSRITTLLGNLGLMHRIISEGCTIQNDTIDYRDANEKLKELQDLSIEFLKHLDEGN